MALDRHCGQLPLLWRRTSFEERARLMQGAAAVLRCQRKVTNDLVRRPGARSVSFDAV